MKGDYIPPDHEKKAFHCPHCGVYAAQHWSFAGYILGSWQKVEGFSFSQCSHCSAFAVWFDDRMIFPLSGAAPLPHPKLPDDIRRDYEEAREIAAVSPRGAAALLRLSIQKLCKHLGRPGKNINTDIGALMKQGLPSQIQQALDVVRVIGNDAVHPGTLDLRDNPQIAGALFELVNIITEKMIAEPEKIKRLYEGLPHTKKAAIAKRDGKP